jgi:hypothetical protein
MAFIPKVKARCSHRFSARHVLLAEHALSAPLYPIGTMSQHSPSPKVNLALTPDYRESYSNSVQVQISVWDFRLSFGTVHQESNDQITIQTFQGIYLSPQQAKALWGVLGQNLAQYEQTFGTIALEPKSQAPNGPVH